MKLENWMRRSGKWVKLISSYLCSATRYFNKYVNFHCIMEINETCNNINYDTLIKNKQICIGGSPLFSTLRDPERFQKRGRKMEVDF